MSLIPKPDRWPGEIRLLYLLALTRAASTAGAGKLGQGQDGGSLIPLAGSFKEGRLFFLDT